MDYEAIKKDKGAADILSSRLQAVITIKSLIISINTIDKDSPNLLQFRRLEDKLLAEISSFEKYDKSFRSLVCKKNPDLQNDAEFKKELRRSDIFIEDCMTVLDDYNGIIATKKLDPPEEVRGVPPDLVQKLMEDLAGAQLRLTDAVSTSTSSRGSPRPEQPFFTPKGTNEDYSSYKEFKNHFLF